MYSFLQSKGWEKFQQSVGHQTFRIDGVLLIKKKLPLGKSYLYCPRVETQNLASLQNFLQEVRDLAKKENAIFLRIEPINVIRYTLYVIRKVDDVQPSKTIILDLTKSEDELLKNMHPKTRYNIRLAERKGVKIIETHSNASLQKFWELMKETVRRDGFRVHSRKYYEKMLRQCSSDGIASPSARNDNLEIKLYFAEYKGEGEIYQSRLLAAGIFAFYDDAVTYLHGASAGEHRNIMAPYLLHWEIIKLAKKLGYKYYDFYGVDEKKWPGLTRFKRGFGGKEINYPGTFDVVYSRRWYWVYRIVRKLRRLFRT